MVTAAALQSAFRRVPRLPLATLPTPIHDAVHLRQVLGGRSRCPRILIKRDDLTGLALGGNKARKLEFLVADALERRADTLITTGGTQSNHARMTAAAACIAGLDCHLVLTLESSSPAMEGNLLLDRLYGATVHHVSASAAVASDDEKVRELEIELTQKGKKTCVIPLGGSNELGTLGYALATIELAEQLSSMGVRASRLYYASGSRGTQAGLTLGAKLCATTYRVYGVAVSSGGIEKTLHAQEVARKAADLLGVNIIITDDDLFTDDDFIGEGYGIPTVECLEAIAMLARTEGILLDPCYTGKAMAALIAHVRNERVQPDETIVFLHTGGVPALFTSEFVHQMQAYS